MAKSGQDRIRTGPALPSNDKWAGEPVLWKAGRILAPLALTLLLAALLVGLIELIARDSWTDALAFFTANKTPAWSTILIVALALAALDALLGRAYLSVLVLAPLVLALAFTSHEKVHYLGDPLYPVDVLYARQVIHLLPLLAGQRPLTMAAVVIGLVAGIAFFVWTFLFWRRKQRPMPWRGRVARLVIALPALAFFASIMDYSSFSWVRDRLQIIPMMWDQRENYSHNGFTAAFILNVPMADLAAPKGYSATTIHAIPAVSAVAAPAVKPDIIIVMNESFWDPTRLPNTKITPDPIPTVRREQSGYIFSPEFGGTTPNIEFEALTGFSNAFLPYGSIPYQQYIRRPTPSLARFFNSQGYETRALHPFLKWFWNRGPVYERFGFDKFMSEEVLPPIAKRGPLASDGAFFDEIMREADRQTKPFFFFAVTLQNHGPYEAHRYARTAVSVTMKGSEDSRQSLLSYAEGAHDADKALARLIDWAKHRSRPTILAMFGDHLPPLGEVYVDSGFMRQPVAPRRAPLAEMRREHETPLVVWSNRTGAEKNIGTISPALLPDYILELAGFTHPYYTGFLGQVRAKYHVIDRYMLMTPDGLGEPDWQRKKSAEPLLNQYRYLQYDAMFGRKYGAETFFPEMAKKPASVMPAS